MSLKTIIPKKSVGELCPACRSVDTRPMSKIGVLVKRKSRYGRFLGCSRYPECKYTAPVENSPLRKK